MKIFKFNNNFFGEEIFFKIVNKILPLFDYTRIPNINQNEHTYGESCIIELHKKANDNTYQIKDQFQKTLKELSLIDNKGNIEYKECAIPIIKSVISFTNLGYEGPVILLTPDEIYETPGIIGNNNNPQD